MSNRKNYEWHAREKWIIPPGLAEIVKRFKIRCRITMTRKKSRPLLIHGETGVGKSLFVDYYAMMYKSIFKKNPKIAYINCAALPSELIESLLFGHTKGIFSGAERERVGYFEEVDDGIIVLEELGEMPKNLQSKLLLVIENRVFSKIGAHDQIEFKSKILATTNVSRDQFRDDLWYRFDTFYISSICERRQDILYYIQNFEESIFEMINPGIALSLLSYNWPGNAREIERVCMSIEENIAYTNQYIAEIKHEASKNNEHIDPTKVSLYLSFDKNVTGFEFNKIEKFKSELIQHNIQYDAIEDSIMSSGLNFDSPLYQKDDIYMKWEETLTIDDDDSGENFVYISNINFDLAYSGFLIFCKLFFQDPESNYDILDFKKIIKRKPYDSDMMYLHSKLPDYITLPIDVNDYPRIKERLIEALNHLGKEIYNSNIEEAFMWPEIFKKALKESIKYIAGIGDIEIENSAYLDNIPHKEMKEKFLIEYYGKDPNELENREIPITQVSLKMIRQLYLETLCHEVGMEDGFQRKIAAMAGLSEGRISQDADIKNLKHIFNNLKISPRKRIVVLD